MLHSLERHVHLFVLLFLSIIQLFMFALAETMYLCRTLGELLRMHSGCFCYRSNNVWFWKEQGLVSFAEMKCQKCKHFGAHNTPSRYIMLILINVEMNIYIYLHVQIKHVFKCEWAVICLVNL